MTVEDTCLSALACWRVADTGQRESGRDAPSTRTLKLLGEHLIIYESTSKSVLTMMLLFICND